MKVTYRNLFTDVNNIDFAVLKSSDTNCLCLQSSIEKTSRIKKAYLSSQYFQKQIPDNCFKSISLNQDVKGNLVTALFEYQDCGQLTKFLATVPKSWQYATGKKLGLILRQLHSYPLTEKQKTKAVKRHDSYMEHLATYIADLPHFKNDRFALDALSSRYDHFRIYKAVLRYGSLKHQKLMLTKDSSLILLPSYAFGPGDMCEDFASLECECAGLYPVLCAGVIDGYFNEQVPVKFWIQFALYSALYSLWKCRVYAKQSTDMMVKMQLNCDRIREDFNDFKNPIPSWYSDPLIKDLRKEALKLAF